MKKYYSPPEFERITILITDVLTASTVLESYSDYIDDEGDWGNVDP